MPEGRPLMAWVDRVPEKSQVLVSLEAAGPFAYHAAPLEGALDNLISATWLPVHCFSNETRVMSRGRNETRPHCIDCSRRFDECAAQDARLRGRLGTACSELEIILVA